MNWDVTFHVFMHRALLITSYIAITFFVFGFLGLFQDSPLISLTTIIGVVTDLSIVAILKQILSNYSISELIKFNFSCGLLGYLWYSGDQNFKKGVDQIRDAAKIKELLQ